MSQLVDLPKPPPMARETPSKTIDHVIDRRTSTAAIKPTIETSMTLMRAFTPSSVMLKKYPEIYAVILDVAMRQQEVLKSCNGETKADKLGEVFTIAAGVQGFVDQVMEELNKKARQGGVWNGIAHDERGRRDVMMVEQMELGDWAMKLHGQLNVRMQAAGEDAGELDGEAKVSFEKLDNRRIELDEHFVAGQGDGDRADTAADV